MEGDNELSSNSSADNDSSFEEDSDSVLELDSDLESAEEDAALSLAAVTLEELSVVDTSLVIGIVANDVAAVQRALRNGANWNRRAAFSGDALALAVPLWWVACVLGYDDIVRILLKAGPIPEGKLTWVTQL